MSSGTKILTLAAVLTAAATVTSFAHEDDPKIFDRQPAFQGPGYRAIEAATGGAGGHYGPLGDTFDSDGVTLLSWLPLGNFGNPSNGADCWGYVSQLGREYAILCTSSGTAFVEITNPGNPQLVEIISGPGSLWRDTKVYQNRAYTVSEGGSGIQVINLANIDAGIVTLERTITGPGTSATHNVAIDEDSGFLYRCGGDSNGLRIYDLANPGNPQHVASWSDRYVHDAQIVTYDSGPYAGRQIAFCCSGYNGGWTDTGLDILDVTDKNNIIEVSRIAYSGRAYSHQGWLSADRQYFYLGDELDEQGSENTRTIIFDVSDINNPSQAGQFTNNSRSVGHNIYTVGNTIYEANYRSGLRIFDATNPTSPVEVAYFDTYPGSDSASFNGLWSNFPYFPSGVVIGSDMERGLFVFWVGEPQLTFQYPQGLPELFLPEGATLRFDITEANPGDLDASSVKLFFDRGQGFEEATISDLGSNRFEAAFPDLPCGQSISYYVTADATNGLTWSDPPLAPGETHNALAASGITEVLVDDMETNLGWTGGIAGDDATTGIWTRVNPRGTDAQPEDDHTPDPGIRCWVTGQGPAGGGIGDNDVDGGTTTLLSPVLNLSGTVDPKISYWRWYSNDEGGAPNQDTFVIQITNNGSSWITVETVGPGGSESSGGWFFHDFRVADFVTPNATIQMRFRASDLGDGSIVEAAIDDFRAFDLDCDGDIDPPGDCVTPFNYGNPTAGSGDILPTLTSSNGWPSIGNANWQVNAADFLGGATGTMIIGFEADSDTSLGWERLVKINFNTLIIPVAYPGGGAGGGALDVTLSIPNNPFIVGTQFFIQFTAFDGGAPAGVAATPGLECVICDPNA